MNQRRVGCGRGVLQVCLRHAQLRLRLMQDAFDPFQLAAFKVRQFTPRGLGRRRRRGERFGLLGPGALPGHVLFPLLAVGIRARVPISVQPYDVGGNPIQQVTVVSHQHQRAGELHQAVFQDFQRRDVKIVGRFVEQQNVGRLQHQPGNHHAGLLPAGEAAHRNVKLLGAEHKTGGPSGDVDGAFAEYDDVMRRQGFAQGDRWVQLRAVLIEVDHADVVGALEFPGIRFGLARDQAQQSGLAAAVRTQQAQARARGKHEREIAEQRFPAQRLGDPDALHQALGPPVGGAEIDLRAARLSARGDIAQVGDHAPGAIDARFRFRGTGLGTAPQPFDLAPDFVFERLLILGLRVLELVLPDEELAVVAVHAEEPLRIDPVDLHHAGGDVLQKIAVVADDQRGERRPGEHLFQPQDPLQIQMIGGLVHDQQFGVLQQFERDCEALAPPARERGNQRRGVEETHSTQDFVGARGPLRVREVPGDFHRVDGPLNGEVQGSFPLLRHVAEAQQLARRDIALVQIQAARQNA